MITHDLAHALALAGLRWTPRSGDTFCIPGGELESTSFVVSELTIEPRSYPSGTILAFNGTTEWALDSVAAEDTLWLPREDQLRTALGAAFVALRRGAADAPDEAWVVTSNDGEGRAHEHDGVTPAEAYGRALLALLQSATR